MLTSNIKKNATLHEIDELVQRVLPDPEHQAGVLMLALVLAVRRRIAVQPPYFDGPIPRPARLRIVRALVADYEAKLRAYLRPEPETTKF